MCGIVGYIGKREALPVLVRGLKKLEYRGYDSAGIAVIHSDRLFLCRSEGKISKLEQKIKSDDLYGNIGLGHTRWATHGRPSEENAHPHIDCKSRIVVVHNGIIENYLDIKRGLMKEGHGFLSETDTEVIAHLIEKHYKGDLLKAVNEAVKKLKGSFALAVMSADEPDRIIVARYFSPLILGLGKKEYFLASDVPAVLDWTRKVIYLDDGEVASVSDSGISVYKEGKKVKKSISTINWDNHQAEKGGFKHYMLKEIFEQPESVQDTFRGRLYPSTGDVLLDGIDYSPSFLKNLKRISIIACGTSYHAGMVGKYLFEKLCKLPCDIDIASEFRYRSSPVLKDTLVIAISQSGETADTLAALRLASHMGARSLGVCNVMGSSLSREADNILYTRAGPEIGVASSKAFTSQLTALCVLCLYLAVHKRTLSSNDVKTIMMELLRIPQKINRILEDQRSVKGCAQRYFHKKDFLYLGRNYNYPIALEGALKLKEISYIHAEGYPAGEMKHGPIALIDEDMPVLTIATDSDIYPKIMANADEVKSRGGILIALATEGNKEIKQKADWLIYVPRTIEMLSPILNVIPLQLLAYHIAVKRGCDVDQPRNLAKSVTVE